MEHLQNQIEVRPVKTLDDSSVRSLYQAVGWWKTDWEGTPGWISRMVGASTCFYAAFHQDRLIGMGRAISDGISDAYIQDVAVHPDYQRLGLGRRLVDALTRELKEMGVTWIALIAEPGSELFYRQLGFRTMSAYTPMLLEIRP